MTNIKYNSYFQQLPLIKYDPNHAKLGAVYDTATNIFFRIRVIQEVLDNINTYFVAEIEEDETPEIVAEKIYGDAGAGWIVTIANNIIDPQWEWPLNYQEFQNYIIGKYGSVANAQTTIHHYEMVVTRTLQPDNVVTEHRYTIDVEKLTDNVLSVPHYYYTPHMTEDHDSGLSELQPGSLATHEYVNTFNVDGKTITEVINGEYTYVYDYEENLNSERRFIKLIKPEYYSRILSEYIGLTGGYKNMPVRTVR